MSDSARLDEVIRRVLDLEPGADLTTIRYHRTPTWDSVAHLEMLLELEEAFDFCLDCEGVPSLPDYASIRDLVDRPRPPGPRSCGHHAAGPLDA